MFGKKTAYFSFRDIYKLFFSDLTVAEESNKPSLQFLNVSSQKSGSQVALGHCRSVYMYVFFIVSLRQEKETSRN